MLEYNTTLDVYTPVYYHLKHSKDQLKKKFNSSKMSHRQISA